MTIRIVTNIEEQGLEGVSNVVMQDCRICSGIQLSTKIDSCATKSKSIGYYVIVVYGGRII